MKPEDPAAPDSGTSQATRTGSPATGLAAAFHFAVEHFLVLPVSAVIALVWANTSPESYYQFAYALSFAINDVGMVFFFGLITKEIAESTAPKGALHTWRRMTLPIVAAVGGTIVSVLFYLWFVYWVEEPMIERAWAIACATDIAFSYFVALSIFRRHPAIPFLLLLAIAFNTIGLVALSVFNPIRDPQIVVAVLLMAVAIGVTRQLRRSRVKNFWPYILLGGGASWAALYLGGLHPALALVPIIPFLPHAARDPGLFVEALPGARDTLSRFDRWFRYPVQIVLFLFGLVNAGATLYGLETGTLGLPLAMLAGKPIGILAAVALAIAAGLHFPRGFGWRDLVVVAFTATIAFTMGLFFATIALAPGPLLLQAKVGALLSLSGGLVALAVALITGVGRFARPGDSRP